MRRERVTYREASETTTTSWIVVMGAMTFLQATKTKARKMRIRLFTYCLMDNHYHLVLENSRWRRTGKGQVIYFQETWDGALLFDFVRPDALVQAVQVMI